MPITTARASRSFRIAALLLATLLSAPAAPWGGARCFAQAQSLPARLSDQEFSAFITAVSEPNGFFNSDNLLSNELTYQHVIPTLQQLTKPGGVYLGVGPEQNFTYIVAMQPKMAVIFDIRRGNMLLHLLYKALFELSSDRADFVGRMYARPRPPGLDTASSVASLYRAYGAVRSDSVLYRRDFVAVRDCLVKDHGLALSADDLSGIKYVYDAFYTAGPDLDYNYPGSVGSARMGVGQRPTYASLMQADDGNGVQRSYLATEANYRLIKTMETNNMIVPVVGDFAGPKAIVEVGRYLRAHSATATAFYTSNVEQYLFNSPDEWRNYYTNVGTLPIDPSSTFIRAVFASTRIIPGLTGNSSVTLLSPIGALLDAFKAGRLVSYADVVAMSR